MRLRVSAFNLLSCAFRNVVDVVASACATGDPMDDISHAEDADVAGEAVEVKPTREASLEKKVEDEEYDKECENKKPSMAAMRTSFAPGTKPARPALREVN